MSKTPSLIRAALTIILCSAGLAACGGALCFPSEYPFGYVSKSDEVNACAGAVENVTQTFSSCKGKLYNVNVGIGTITNNGRCGQLAQCDGLMDSVMSLCSNCRRCEKYCEACSSLMGKAQPAYAGYMEFLGHACSEKVDEACKKLEKEQQVKYAHCTIKRDEVVAKNVAAMTDAQILEQWERSVSGKLSVADAAFLHESLRYVFTNAATRQKVALELVDKTYAKLNGEARAMVAVSLYTSFVMKQHDPLLVPVVVRVMDRQKYETGEVVILLGELTTQKNTRDVATGIKSQFEILQRPDGGQSLGVRHYDMHALISVNRMMFVPYGVRPEFSDGITLLADKHNRGRIGERMVAIGNFADAETSRGLLEKFEHGKLEAELSGIGKPTLHAFDPAEQAFPEDRCAEWLGRGMYLETL